MTVLPTVRDQIKRAADAQVGTRRRPGRPTPGVVVTACAVAVALAVIVGAVALVRGRPTAGSASAPAGAAAYPLRGDGIGGTRFGDSPADVVAALRPLLGSPEGAGTGQRPGGLLRGICAFDYEIDWVGLAEPRAAVRYTHSVGLTLYFRRSRFVGYAYGPPWGDLATPLVTRGAMLATATGLRLYSPLSRARRLYGAAFVLTTRPQGTPPKPRLERLPAWSARTPTGTIYGYIDSPGGPTSSRDRTIGTISAGSIPNTPCRTSRRADRTR